MQPTIILCFVNVDFFSISMKNEFTSFSLECLIMF